MPNDPELRAHQQWIGYVQPVGLVVSPQALLNGQAHVNANVAAEHQRFLQYVHDVPTAGRSEPVTAVTDLPGLLLDVFGWRAADLAPADDSRATSPEVVLTEYRETLRPTFAVPDDAKADPPTSLLLIQQMPTGTPLDEVAATADYHWQASPEARFERLLWELKRPVTGRRLAVWRGTDGDEPFLPNVYNFSNDGGRYWPKNASINLFRTTGIRRRQRRMIFSASSGG